MEEVLEMERAKDTNEMETTSSASTIRTIGSSEVTYLFDASMDLLWNDNFWVSQGCRRDVSKRDMRQNFVSKAVEDRFLDVVRANVVCLIRIRYLRVVHVVQALDESKYAIVMVTEPLSASVANILGNLANVAKVPKELKGMKMGLLEVKHELLQVSKSLD